MCGRAFPDWRIAVYNAVTLICCAAGPLATAEELSEPLISTSWGRALTADVTWPEYPRPQLVRPRWQNLNGIWDLAIQPTDKVQPTTFPLDIRVPFCIESQLGGVRRVFTAADRAWYRRHFTVPREWRNQRIILHFGAVDYRAEVWVNGNRIGVHQGGFTPFSFDISEALDSAESHELIVAVNDPTDAGFQPRGKQQIEPNEIWYTPVSGIWQTVWLEPQPQVAIERLVITPLAETGQVVVEARVTGATSETVITCEVLEGESVVGTGSSVPGESATIALPTPRLWSPADPFLYGLRVRCKSNGSVDEVTSYFGLRSVRLGKDANGLTRILLNGQPFFQYGPLDQGYWPDGLYTAPSDEAMRSDLDVVKQLGFNMVRKHVKVEPARWYYWCDQLGLLVWQDMPNGDERAPWPQDTVEIDRAPASQERFYRELQQMVDFGYNYPCIVTWVAFNEAWGQFDTERVSTRLKQMDPSRIVVAASGGNDFGVGDVHDDHFYPGPGGPPSEERRASVLGEFGGFGLPVRDHTWKNQSNWGYRSFTTPDELQDAYLQAVDRLRPLVESNLSAAVYTQLADVEIEVNGLLTYDRAMLKVDRQLIREAHAKLLAPLPPPSEARRLHAPTLAWWRFENAPVGQRVADISSQMGAIAVSDSSGHNNHLYAFSDQSAPRITRRTAPQRFGRLGVESLHCLQDTEAAAGDAPLRDLFTDPNLSRTHMDVLDSYPLNDFTVEVSFRLQPGDKPQTILAKQGQATRGIETPLQIGTVEPQGPLVVEVRDQKGTLHTLRGPQPLEPNRWHDVALISSGQMLSLYLFDKAQHRYQLLARTQTAGGLVRSTGIFTLGRGFERGKMGRDFQGEIDEVRISTLARSTSDLLHAQPE